VADARFAVLACLAFQSGFEQVSEYIHFDAVIARIASLSVSGYYQGWPSRNALSVSEWSFPPGRANSIILAFSRIY
jgi:hypothetical protein